MTDQPSILDLLDLEYVEQDLYRSRAVYEAPWGMFGGQAAAQALYAAGLTVGKDRLPHSLHGYFLRRAAGRGWYTATVCTADGTRIASVAQEQIFTAKPRR